MIKVRIKGYLKVGGEMIPKGATFKGDSLSDLPDWVQVEVKAKSSIIDVSEFKKAKDVVSLIEEEVKAEKEAEALEAQEKAEAEEAEAEEAEALEAQEEADSKANTEKKPPAKRIRRKPKG